MEGRRIVLDFRERERDRRILFYFTRWARKVSRGIVVVVFFRIFNFYCDTFVIKDKVLELC